MLKRQQRTTESSISIVLGGFGASPCFEAFEALLREGCRMLTVRSDAQNVHLEIR